MNRKADFSADWFADYLTRRTGKPVTVEAFEKFTRGTSRQTWFASFREKGAEAVDIVLRTDHPAGSGDPTNLDQEYAVYKALGATSIPHAHALWWEDDQALCPRPFYLREKVAGSWQVPGFDAPKVKLAAAKEHMRALALVHDADWEAVGFGELLGAPKDENDAAAHFVRLQRARWDSFGGEPGLLLAEVAEFLLDHSWPAARISLCKGTNGLGEEVFRDGQIVAMSDWEQVLVGDPASDLAMVQGFTEPILRDGETIWDLEHAIEH